MSDQVKDEKRQAAADGPGHSRDSLCLLQQCCSPRKFNDPFCRKAEYLFRYQNISDNIILCIPPPIAMGNHTQALSICHRLQHDSQISEVQKGAGNSLDILFSHYTIKLTLRLRSGFGKINASCE
jgi:hypothetical protein